MREQGSRTRQMLEQQALALGIDLPFAIEAEGREAVREIVATGAGIGFVSEAEFTPDSRLVVIRLASAPIRMHEKLICLRDRKFLGLFIDTAKQHPHGQTAARLRMIIA